METGVSIVYSPPAPQIDETILEINGSCTSLCQNGEVEPGISWSFQISDSLGLVSLQDRRLSIISGALTEIAVSSDVQNVDTKIASEVGLVTLPLRASLFQFSPPTLHFSYAEEIDHALLESVKSVMIWQLTSTTPRILKKILINSGFKFTKQLDTWIGTWTKNVRAYEFQNLASYQKFNHFPGTFQIGRKDRLWRTIYRMQQLHSYPEFGFVPDTFILPNDLKKLLSTWKSEKNEHRWIVKPPASARGKGVHIIHRLDQLPKHGSFVIQKYLSKPYLINGTKFDLRVYVYVTSFNPLRIYVYEDGLVRFASVRFSNATHSLNDRYMHLTNCTVNKNHSSYTISKDNKSCDGQKWSLKAFWTYLQSNGIDTDEIWNRMTDLIIKTVISCEPSVHTLCRGNVSSGYLCHEMFGFDIILDHDLKPWLLEVNVSPSLDSKSSLDKQVKGKMMAELLNLAGYKLPPHLSKSGQKEVARILKIDSSSVCFNVHTYQSSLSNDELEKQTKFAVFERDLYLNNILENITTKDVIYLTEAEDELNRSEFFQRIFPSKTSFNYHKYFKSPQYYTNLLDAWEHKYWGEREIGRQLLWKLSEQFKFLRNSVNNSAPEHNVTTSRRCRNRTCGLNVKLRTRRRSATSSYRKEVSFKRRCIFYQ